MCQSRVAAPDYSVCIATYRRPEMLRELLESLLAQEFFRASAVEIIVVDNDAERTGAPVVADFAARPGAIIRYFAQGEKNIAITRNLAVRMARGRYLYFIDDDEVASPRWMQLLWDTMANFDADAVFGRVTPRFHEQAPSWMRGVFLFNRHCGPTGARTRRPRTSNCLVKTELLTALDGPFDPAFGITGGEDTQLFARLSAGGARFIDCYEAEVEEIQPPERTSWVWLRNRALRTGSLQTLRQTTLAGDGRAAARWRHLYEGARYAAACGLMSLFTLPDKARSADWLLRAHYGLGRIWGVFRRPPDGY